MSVTEPRGDGASRPPTPGAPRILSRMAAADRLCIVLVLLTLSCASGAPLPAESQRDPASLVLPELGAAARFPERVMLISIARLTADRYASRADRKPDMPLLARLAREGVSADTVTSVAPASAYPSHASLVTGHRPDAHGVGADLRIGSHGVRSARYWHASYIATPTLWDIAHEAKLRVAALAWPSTVGAPIPLLIPDLAPRKPGESWLAALADAATPELLHWVQRLGGDAPAVDAEGPERDAVLSKAACELLASPLPPRLLLLRLSQTVSPVALHGADSVPARRAFERIDGEITALFHCMARIGVTEEVAILIVGDHGVLPVHTAVAPNVPLVDAGLVKLTARGTVDAWSALARSNGGSAFLHAIDEESALAARRILEEEARRSRAFRLVPAAEMVRQGADREAWFGLEALPGYYFSNATSPPLLAPGALRAVGGYLPDRAEMNTGFVAWGRGLRRRTRVPLMRLTDVAPTAARLLRVDFTGGSGGAPGRERAELDGRVLVGILNVPSQAR